MRSLKKGFTQARVEELIPLYESVDSDLLRRTRDLKRNTAHLKLFGGIMLELLVAFTLFDVSHPTAKDWVIGAFATASNLLISRQGAVDNEHAHAVGQVLVGRGEDSEAFSNIQQYPQIVITPPSESG